jgi:hypothetical protein
MTEADSAGLQSYLKGKIGPSCVCVRSPKFGKSEGRTAGPSTSLRCGRDDKGEGDVSIEDWFVAERTAGPSTSLPGISR